MKTLILGLALAFGIAGTSNAQCGAELASGCAGTCGMETVSYTVTADDVNSTVGKKHATLCVSQTGSSLCPNTGARVTVYVNGKAKANVNLTAGQTGTVRAKAGDVVTMVPSMYATNQEIQCIWLGETYYGLGRK